MLEKLKMQISVELQSSGEKDLSGSLGLVSFKEVQGRCLDAQVVLKVSQIFQPNTVVRISFVIDFSRVFVAVKLGRMVENNALFIGKLQVPSYV